MAASVVKIKELDVMLLGGGGTAAGAEEDGNSKAVVEAALVVGCIWAVGRRG